MESRGCYPVSVQVSLIRQIQVEIGHKPCYATVAADYCAYVNCCWRSDCYCEGGGDSAHNGSMDFYFARG